MFRNTCAHHTSLGDGSMASARGAPVRGLPKPQLRMRAECRSGQAFWITVLRLVIGVAPKPALGSISLWLRADELRCDVTPPPGGMRALDPKTLHAIAGGTFMARGMPLPAVRLGTLAADFGPGAGAMLQVLTAPRCASVVCAKGPDDSVDFQCGVAVPDGQPVRLLVSARDGGCAPHVDTTRTLISGSLLALNALFPDGMPRVTCDDEVVTPHTAHDALASVAQHVAQGELRGDAARVLVEFCHCAGEGQHYCFVNGVPCRGGLLDAVLRELERACGASRNDLERDYIVFVSAHVVAARFAPARGVIDFWDTSSTDLPREFSPASTFVNASFAHVVPRAVPRTLAARQMAPVPCSVRALSLERTSLMVTVSVSQTTPRQRCPQRLTAAAALTSIADLMIPVPAPAAVTGAMDKFISRLPTEKVHVSSDSTTDSDFDGDSSGSDVGSDSESDDSDSRSDSGSGSGSESGSGSGSGSGSSSESDSESSSSSSSSSSCSKSARSASKSVRAAPVVPLEPTAEVRHPRCQPLSHVLLFAAATLHRSNHQ